MKKIYVTLLFTMSLVVGVNAQSDGVQKNRYYYSSTTENALEELKNSTSHNKALQEASMLRLELEQSNGKVVLSTKEYAPIKKRIDSAPTLPANTREEELKVWANDAKRQYVLVTDLIKK